MRSATIEVTYLNVELSGQCRSNSAAQIAEEAVDEYEDILRTLSPISALLMQQPNTVITDLIQEALHWIAKKKKCWEETSTHRKQEISKSSMERELRPMGTQSSSASREKQVESESSQNSARVERNASGFPLVSLSLSILVVNLFTYGVTRDNASMGPTCKFTSRTDGAAAWSPARFLGGAHLWNTWRQTTKTSSLNADWKLMRALMQGSNKRLSDSS